MKAKKLTHHWDFKGYPAVASAITVLVGWCVVSAFFGPSVKQLPAALFIWTALTLVLYEPLSMEESAWVYILLFFAPIVGALYCLFVSKAIFISITAAVLFAIAMVLVIMLELVRISHKHFRQLIEIIPVRSTECALTEGLTPLFSFVSDIHITYSDSVARAEGGPGGQSKFALWLEREAVRPPRYLVIGGDETDTGSGGEWDRFAKIAQQCRNKKSTIVFTLGNHDCYSAYTSPGLGSSDGLWLYLQKLALFAPATEMSTGDTLKQIVKMTSKELEPEIEKRAAIIFDDKDSTQRQRFPEATPEFYRDDARAQAERELFWPWFEKNRENLFPLQLLDPVAAVVILILNSCPDDPFGRQLPPNTLGPSAIGRFGRGQLDRLRQILTAKPEWCKNLIVLTHHAPFRRPGEWKWPLSRKGIQESAFLVHNPSEAREFLALLAEQAHLQASTNFHLCCGHRHTPTLAYAGRTLVLEGPSLAEGHPTAWQVYVRGSEIAVTSTPIP